MNRAAGIFSAQARCTRPNCPHPISARLTDDIISPTSLPQLILQEIQGSLGGANMAMQVRNELHTIGKPQLLIMKLRARKSLSRFLKVDGRVELTRFHGECPRSNQRDNVGVGETAHDLAEKLVFLGGFEIARRATGTDQFGKTLIEIS